jgi:hypothetical protein
MVAHRRGSLPIEGIFDSVKRKNSAFSCRHIGPRDVPSSPFSPRPSSLLFLGFNRPIDQDPHFLQVSFGSNAHVGIRAVPWIARVEKLVNCEVTVAHPPDGQETLGHLGGNGEGFHLIA